MFTHLHVHTEYSLLDGMCRIPQLIQKTKELGMNSIAITDHGSMYGVIDFYQEAKNAGVKPIIGSEFYVAQTDHTNRTAAEKSSYHVVLLAKNLTGYRNLMQLTTKAHLEGFYYKPKIDRALMEKYHEGLIALSACMSGEVSVGILQNQLQEARDTAAWYKDVFGDFYLEIQRNPVPELDRVNRGLIEIGRALNIPLAATNDVHYVNQDDAPFHDILLCIGTNSVVTDTKRVKMSGDFLYLKSPAEMAANYQDIPDAVENTGRIAEMCDLKLDFTRLHLPEIELPPGKSAQEYLKDLCYQGFRTYYPHPTPELEQRLQYELEVIEMTQFANYFLVVWDMFMFARKRNIMVGVRGSAAASIVLHCLGITSVDPVEHKLVFERFLNIERKEMPDIDSDFEDYRRQEVIDYVSKKYGADHVAQIITFGTLGARAALRDVGRALGMSYGDVDRVARLVPFGVGMTLDHAMEINAELSQIYQADAIIRKLVDSARRVEGIARHASTHAAGIVISKEPLTRHVPLQQVSKGESSGLVMTQYSMDNIAKIGLLKMDFLGLANLTVLAKAKAIIQDSRGIDLDLFHLPMDDQKTFDLLAAGETTGVFQLESAGMRRYIKDLKPNCFSDIAAMVALYRPGPMEHIPKFIRSKHGLEAITYPHPALEKILEETYGVIVYQDQVLFIVRQFAGYSLGQADIFRKAMGKKIPEVMQKEKANFINGAKKLGYSEEIASTIFALIEPFAGYAFNKAHSVSYALIAYQTAYLKANFPSEYMTAFLITNTDDQEKVSTAISECRRLGINVRPADVNQSEVSFALEDSGNPEKRAIRFGLAAIKNVGPGAVQPLIAERLKNGPIKSIDDFCRRLDGQTANKRVLESLIKAGALDSLVGNRGALLNSLDRVLAMAQAEQKLRSSGQATMFDLFGQSAAVPMPGVEISGEDVSAKEKLAWERELMGVYLSEHPFARYAKLIDTSSTMLPSQVNAELDGQSITLVGMIDSLRELTTTKDHKPFCSTMVTDDAAVVEVMVWPRTFEDTRDIWKEGNFVLIQGKVKVKDDRVQVTCDAAEIYNPENGTRPALIPVVPIPVDASDARTEPERPRQSLPVSAARPTNGKNGQGNGGNGKIFNGRNGQGSAANGTSTNGRTANGQSNPPAAPPPPPKRLTITIQETEDVDKDETFLNSLNDLFKDYSGWDEVFIRVVKEEQVDTLKWPSYIDCTPDLLKRLEKLVSKEQMQITDVIS